MTEFKKGDMVRRTKPDSKGRHWGGTVLSVSRFGPEARDISVMVRWDSKPSETWFYSGKRLAEIDKQ